MLHNKLHGLVAHFTVAIDSHHSNPWHLIQWSFILILNCTITRYAASLSFVLRPVTYDEYSFSLFLPHVITESTATAPSMNRKWVSQKACYIFPEENFNLSGGPVPRPFQSWFCDCRLFTIFSWEYETNFLLRSPILHRSWSSSDSNENLKLLL